VSDLPRGARVDDMVGAVTMVGDYGAGANKSYTITLASNMVGKRLR